MKVSAVRRLGLVVVGASLALAPVLAEAAGRASRGGGGGGGARSAGAARSGGGGTKVTRTATRSAPPSAGHSTSAARGTAPRGGKQTASGRATYGYYHGGHGYYPGYPYYPYYPYYPGYWDPWYWGSSWGVSFSYGWPYYYGYGAGYPYPYPYAEDAEPPSVPAGPASVEIDVRPGNAQVLLNGEDIGRAKDYDGRWDRLQVPAGRQWFEFRADGYKTLRVAVDATSWGSFRLDDVLEKGEGIDPRSHDPAALPAPAARLEKGLLRLSVAPADAAVYLDGTYFARGDEVAKLRGAIPLAAGEHRIEVVRPGFAAQSVVVLVEGGITATAAVELQPAQP